jgi:hypothetical protein
MVLKIRIRRFFNRKKYASKVSLKMTPSSVAGGVDENRNFLPRPTNKVLLGTGMCGINTIRNMHTFS